MHPFHPNKEEHALGLRAIYTACRNLYPDQPTPLQVTAVKKFWMGGPDPLDFINMYANSGSSELNSPPHWHYITNGLSDLYGDSRLHNYSNSSDGPSGFGFELTFRVKRESGETNPPTWPAHLLQSLARYVFHSQAQLMSGDHIPWPTALDKQPHKLNEKQNPNSDSKFEDTETTRRSIAMAAAATAASILAANSSKSGDSSISALSNPSTYASMVAAALAAVNSSEHNTNTDVLQPTCQTSRIHHMLLVEDQQLKRICTPYGYVQFLQLVGLCNEELRLVQRWTGSQVADIMSRSLETGGGLLVTDMQRKLNLFELKPNLVDYIHEKLCTEGSSLSGVTTSYFAWAPITMDTLKELLPSELESRQHCEAQRSQSSVNTFLTSLNIPKNIKTVSSSSKEQSFHNLSDRFIGNKNSMVSSKSMAMDTDDTLISFSAKKLMNDEEFVDVVGDDLIDNFNVDNLAYSPPSIGQEHSSSKISRYSSKFTSNSSNSKVNQNILTPPGCFSSASNGKNLDGQTISAPGGFSAWSVRGVGFGNNQLLNSSTHQNITRTAGGSPSIGSGPLGSTSIGLGSIFGGALGFKSFVSDKQHPELTESNNSANKRSHTPGSTGDGSAPCTPLAHLSLSPSSLDLFPARVIDCLDVRLCREAGEMLSLAVNDRLRHGRHFTFLNANHPDHAITLVPVGVSGAFVTEDTPYVARGPWLQILLTDDFLEQLEFQFSCLLYPDELNLPLVFRWPERRLRICLVDINSPTSNQHGLVSRSASNITPNPISWTSESLSTETKQQPKFQSNSSSQTNSKDISSALSLSQSGCIPLPHILTALFNNTSQNDIQGQPHFGLGDKLQLYEHRSATCSKSADIVKPKTDSQHLQYMKWLNSLSTAMRDHHQPTSQDNITGQSQAKFALFLEMMQNTLSFDPQYAQFAASHLSINSCSASSATNFTAFSHTVAAPSTKH